MEPVFRKIRWNFSPGTLSLSGLCCLVLLLSAGPSPATTHHVRANGTGDGTSWERASSNLADILDRAVSGDEVWVAQGAYRPTEDRSDFRASFVLRSGVTLYGGFPNTGDPDSGDRDPGTYVTVLTGDIDRNDRADPYGVVPDADGITGKNSYHVVLADEADATSLLDGFTITAGMADDNVANSSGGGLLNVLASPRVSHCRFCGNGALYGGGMYNDFESTPAVTNCTFSGNHALFDGGGMHSEDTNPQVVNCTFRGNSAEANGGGMSNWVSTPTVTGCTFDGNTAAANGGGMFNEGESAVVATNSTFIGNTAKNGGGMYNLDSDPTVTDCIFRENAAAANGGGMCNRAWSNPTLTSCTFTGNNAGQSGDGIANFEGSSPRVLNCSFGPVTSKDIPAAEEKKH